MDPFAHLWANEATNVHAERYSRAVSSYESLAHCLRNRYFFDTLNTLVEENKIDILLNFGCGFSMYPFTLPPSVLYVEIDTTDVISFKKDKTRLWQAEGLLPKRNIEFVSADFNAVSLEYLYNKLLPLSKGKKIFILIEGVLFFLGKEDTTRLFNLFNRLQKKEDFIGSVSFEPSLEKQVVFKKLIDFVEVNLEKNQQFNYQTVPEEFYSSVEGYNLIDHQDTMSLGSIYKPDITISEDEILNEHMYLMQKS
ncbi:MAG: adenosine deaminase [Flavobacteriaceae bacterium]|nr:class I SAM-dependent methyltransferase [Muriicola sp.]NNC61085.1 adenosine deaminase [Eudoraea sp.]NNK20916.1 adenosine deaminase [Flavobacteriaceae bacterium]NNL40732.1 adenosine deaminase [Flavobacteriaceae bacterium]